MRPAALAPLVLTLMVVPAFAQVDVKLDETNSKTLRLPAPLQPKRLAGQDLERRRAPVKMSRVSSSSFPSI